MEETQKTQHPLNPSHNKGPPKTPSLEDSRSSKYSIPNTSSIIEENQNQVQKPERKKNRKLTIRRLNTMPTIEDIDVDKYLDELVPELSELQHSLDERMFIDLILKILDTKCKEYNHNDFNRLLFNHIIEFGNFNRDSPILLQEYIILI